MNVSMINHGQVICQVKDIRIEISNLCVVKNIRWNDFAENPILQ
jgi:hypothetical protein